MPAGTIATAILDTPIGPLSVLAHGAALVGAGFTGDPGELHARLHPSLRPLPLAEAELPWLVKPLRRHSLSKVTPSTFGNIRSRMIIS